MKRGIPLACGLLLLGGCDTKPKPQLPEAKFIEIVKVTGECSEDHVKQSAKYSGDIWHWLNPVTGVHLLSGFVRDEDAYRIERVQEAIEDPARYFTPSMISFNHLSPDDVSGTSLILHGISSPPSGDGSGYHSTCRFTVTERSDRQPPRNNAPE